MTRDTEPEEDDGGELFNLCCDPNCPRDISFQCENLIRYANVCESRSKNKKTGVKTSGSDSSSNLTLKTNVLDLLAPHLIHLSPTSPHKFFCSKCRVHLDDITQCIKHILQQGHQKEEIRSQLEFTVENLSSISDQHCLSLNSCLTSLVKRVAISEDEMNLRLSMIQQLNQNLKDAGIDCSLVLYGSSVTGLGFEDSDMNVLLELPSTQPTNVEEGAPQETAKTQRKILTATEYNVYFKVVSFFQCHPTVSRVDGDFFNKCLRIHIAAPDSEKEVSQERVMCLVKDDEVGVKMTSLLMECSSSCPLFHPLVIVLKYWAKLCKMDDVTKDGLPSWCWCSFVISFLQHVALLPLFDVSMSTNFLTKDCSHRDSVSMENPVLGHLWLQLLQFYAVSSSILQWPVSVVRLRSPIINSKENVQRRKIYVEDPVEPLRGKRHTFQASIPLSEYILGTLRKTLLYFGIPRTDEGPLYDTIIPTSHYHFCSPHIFHQLTVLAEPVTRNETEILETIHCSKWDPLRMIVASKDEADGLEWLQENHPQNVLSSVKIRLFKDHNGRSCILQDDAHLVDLLFPEFLYCYTFEHGDFISQKSYPVWCKTCNSRKHYSVECPLESLGPCDSDAGNNPSERCLKIVDEVISQNFDAEYLRKEDHQQRHEILSRLNSAFSRIYPAASLNMFGSSVSGFGTQDSDLDICLNLGDEQSQDSEPSVKIMSRIHKEMFRLRDFQVVYFVKHARIPIVKFRHKASKLEGDVSCENNLAVENSRLLFAYSQIDHRVQTIGLFWKKLFKISGISGSARAGLCSYGVILMLIHFFQQLDTPVLPILQELRPNEIEPNLVSGWDTNYFSDFSHLKTVWPFYGQNQDTESSLWLQLLDFYSHKFDFEKQVISIRQSLPVTKVSKFWTSYNSVVAIEDPFQISHNVGGSLSRKMSTRIVNAIRRFRAAFYSPPSDSVLKTYGTWLHFFTTDPGVIKDDESVTNTSCLICHRTGYHMPDCPEKRKKKRKWDNLFQKGDVNGNEGNNFYEDVII